MQAKLGSPMVRLLSEVTAVHALSDAVDVYDDSTSRQVVWDHVMIATLSPSKAIVAHAEMNSWRSATCRWLFSKIIPPSYARTCL